MLGALKSGWTIDEKRIKKNNASKALAIGGFDLKKMRY